MVGTITVEPAEVVSGGEVIITANGFEAGELVDITLNPTLATVEADQEGNLSATVTIPEDTEPGVHQLTLTGLTSDNWGEVTLTVLASVPGASTTEPPATDSAPATGDVGGELATTGASTAGLLGVAALLMMVLGVMLVVVHRRRQASITG